MLLKEYAVEFLFDAKTEKKILAFYKQLEHSGFGLPKHILNYQPHITLNVCRVLNLEKLEIMIAEFAKEHSVLPLSLSHLGCFLKPHPVVFLAPTSPQKLFELHSRFLQIAKPFISATRSYYEPDKWVPHCTLAFDFNLDQIAQVIATCSTFDLPIEAQLSSIAVVEVPKGHKVCHYDLNLTT